MDPNEALFVAKQAAQRIIACVDDCVPIDDDDALTVAEALLNLNDCMKRGFYPKEWEK